jgi:hypothetical protein
MVYNGYVVIKRRKKIYTICYSYIHIYIYICISAQLSSQWPSTEHIIIINVIIKDRLCGLVVRAPGYRTEMYCVSCEVRTEFIYVM